MEQVNESVLNELLGRMVNDLGACVNGSLVLIGDKLGLYTALKEAGKATSTGLAEKTSTSE